MHVGNPVRAAVLDREGATYVEPGDRPMGLLVIGGSQGAGLFGRVVPEALAAAGAGAARRGCGSASRCGPRTWTGCARPTSEMGLAADLRGFFDDVPERLAEATLVVSRAGASSIADISVIGRPAILIPYAAAMDDHQAANAAGLVSAGGAFMIREAELTAEGLAGHIAAILARPRRARARWRGRAGARAARTRPNIWRRWSRTSPEKGAEA